MTTSTAPATAFTGLCASCAERHRSGVRFANGRPYTIDNPAPITARVCETYDGMGNRHYIKPRCYIHNVNLRRSDFGKQDIHYCPAEGDGQAYCDTRVRATESGGVSIAARGRRAKRPAAPPDPAPADMSSHTHLGEGEGGAKCGASGALVELTQDGYLVDCPGCNTLLRYPEIARHWGGTIAEIDVAALHQGLPPLTAISAELRGARVSAYQAGAVAAFRMALKAAGLPPYDMERMRLASAAPKPSLVHDCRFFDTPEEHADFLLQRRHSGRRVGVSEMTLPCCRFHHEDPRASTAGCMRPTHEPFLKMDDHSGDIRMCCFAHESERLIDPPRKPQTRRERQRELMARIYQRQGQA